MVVFVYIMVKFEAVGILLVDTIVAQNLSDNLVVQMHIGCLDLNCTAVDRLLHLDLVVLQN
mgnify:CR=1 FL=1